MKTKNEKLTFKKNSVTELDNNELLSVRGGEGASLSTWDCFIELTTKTSGVIPTSIC